MRWPERLRNWIDAMIIGIIGVGHISLSMVAGFLRAGVSPQELLFSPRGKAKELSKLHGIPVGADNADVVRRADVVLLAVRPADALKAMVGLPWREGQVMISMCAGVPLSALHVHPALAVRAMPLISSEFNASPTAFYPAAQPAETVLRHIGPPIAFPSEEAFEIACVNAAVFGWLLNLLGRTVDWMVEKGADEKATRELVARTVIATGRIAIERESESIGSILNQLATPGGITQLGLGVLNSRGTQEVWDEACQAVFDRLIGAKQ